MNDVYNMLSIIGFRFRMKDQEAVFLIYHPVIGGYAEFRWDIPMNSLYAFDRLEEYFNVRRFLDEYSGRS